MSGRTVGATLAGASEQALRAVPGADSIEVRGDTVFIHSGDADKVARYLLTETDAHDLEIASRGLEEAFLALTGDDDTTEGTGDHRRLGSRAPRPCACPADGRVPASRCWRLEIRRLLRNRRTVIFALATPSIFFLLFGLNAAYA